MVISGESCTVFGRFYVTEKVGRSKNSDEVRLNTPYLARMARSGSGETCRATDRVILQARRPLRLEERLIPEISLDDSRVVQHLCTGPGQHGLAVFQNVGVIGNLERLPDILFDQKDGQAALVQLP